MQIKIFTMSLEDVEQRTGLSRKVLWVSVSTAPAMKPNSNSSVDCLGTQTQLMDILQTVRDMQIGVVAISISASLERQKAQQFLVELRAGLPPTCELWAGGQGSKHLNIAALTGCEMFEDTTRAAQRWLALALALRSTDHVQNLLCHG